MVKVLINNEKKEITLILKFLSENVPKRSEFMVANR